MVNFSEAGLSPTLLTISEGLRRVAVADPTIALLSIVGLQSFNVFDVLRRRMPSHKLAPPAEGAFTFFCIFARVVLSLC